ncbi:MAG: methyltransferase [Terriglobia bacterium]
MSTTVSGPQVQPSPGVSEVSPDRIMHLGLGFWASKAVLSAVELGVFTQLAKGGLDTESLRIRLGLHPRAARDFFDTLVALGLLERKDGVYSNSPESNMFLDRAKPSYVGGLLEMANRRLYGHWATLTEGLQTGKPQNEVKSGGNPFEAFGRDPVLLKGFLQAMTGISMGAAQAIARQFPWERYQTFADIGSAQGGTPVQIALAHRHLRGFGYDLPNVQPIFEEYVNSFQLSDRIKFHPGDFFRDALPSVDVLIMGHILHDWNLDEKLMLLRKAHAALPAGGALIVFEALIDDERKKNAFGLLMSLNMLIETQGGFDYTGADCSGWMREAGFRETRVEHLVGPDSMVIGIK